ncbi:MAG: hypothetical protein Rubg2KO_09220 [Rubricoccaceae bacterium]
MTPDSPPNAAETRRQRGLTLLRAGLAIVVAFIVGGGGWILWKAIQNPDVRLKKPSWVEGTFDHSYWLPLLIGVFCGAALVGVVLWTAYKRLRAGEDLFANRTGQGVRRRGERHSDTA